MQAQPGTKSPPFEVEKFHVDVALEADGTYVETREITYRLLTDAAVQTLRQMNLSYTDGYQDLSIPTAYTLKANGTRIDVPQSGMLRGYGASTSPGFEDLKTIQVVFPNLEIGDEVTIVTTFRQIKPWFGNQFAEEFLFSPAVVTRDGAISITAPASLALQVDNIGISGGTAETTDGKVRRTWTYSNAVAAPEESAAVSPLDTGPRLLLSTFSGPAQIAELYRGMMHGKADVTPEVKAQADQIVAGISDRRAQARAIYDWVSTHIGYVNIVLGAGGFIPHAAPDILRTHYGDCKDHVVILTALLAAEGIASQPILIDATNRFEQPKTASPYLFNHLINYLPEFGLYVDSTARFAPFGVLPGADADKPVLNVETGIPARTPTIAADQSTIHTVITATIGADGAADGDTRITMTGSPAEEFRAFFQLVNSGNEDQLFQRFLGPGGTGSLDKGNINALTDPYQFGAHFHQVNAANFPGPAAMYPIIGFRPIAFTPLVGVDLPAVRTKPYMCASFKVDEDITIKFPDRIRFTSLPPEQSLKGEGMNLVVDVERTDQNTIHAYTSLRMDHPQLTCGPDYYARVRPMLVQMSKALLGQIIYRLPEPKN